MCVIILHYYEMLRIRYIYSMLSLCVYVCVAGSRSSSPGKLIGQSYGKMSSVTSAEKRSRIPRSQGCSRESSPGRSGQGERNTTYTRTHTHTEI